MPELLPVPTLIQEGLRVLLEYAFENVLSSPADSCKKWSEEFYHMVSTHLTNAVQEQFFQKVLEKLEDITSVHAKKYDPQIREFVPALLGPHIRSLDLTDFSLVTDKKLMRELYLKLDACGPSLERLALGQSFFFQPELISDLSTKLTSLRQLTCLRVYHVGTSSMITDIGNSCPKLRELCLKGSSKVCDEAVEHIIGCQNLQFLDIQMTSITGTGCLKIIENCSKLQWLDHCPFNCDSDFRVFKSRKEIFDMIKKFYIETGENERPNGRELIKQENFFSIKSFWLFNPKSEEILLTLLCPNVEKVRLDFVFSDTTLNVNSAPLADLQHLQTLDLNFYDGSRVQLFRQILNKCGSKLKKLIYNVSAEYSAVVECHNIIAQCCPDLNSLTFIGDYANLTMPDQDSDEMLIANPGYFHHKLEELKLGGYCTNGRLSWLLSTAPNVKSIYLDGNLEHLSDTAWIDICTNNSLQKLESVWINTSTNMTVNSIDLLLNHCPRLRRIGRLIHLKSDVAEQRREYYRRLVTRSSEQNWDLELVWVTPKRVRQFGAAEEIAAES